jgi:hypothetical protein
MLRDRGVDGSGRFALWYAKVAARIPTRTSKEKRDPTLVLLQEVTWWHVRDHEKKNEDKQSALRFWTPVLR